MKITFEDTLPASHELEEGNGSVQVSPSAAQRIGEILKRRAETGAKFLRVRVDGGGCNGYSYKFMFEATRHEDDIPLEKDGIIVLLDPLSYQYLMGATIDYMETLEASQFTIHNPNAKTHCGCGNSFSL